MRINLETSLSKLSSWAVIWSNDYASSRAKKEPRYSLFSVQLWISSTGDMNLWRLLRPPEWIVAGSPSPHMRPQFKHSAGGTHLLVSPYQLFAFLGLYKRTLISIITSLCFSINVIPSTFREDFCSWTHCPGYIYKQMAASQVFHLQMTPSSAGDPFFCRWPYPRSIMPLHRWYAEFCLW